MKRVVFVLLLFAAFETVGQKLTADEKKVIDLVNRQMPETMQLLEQLVNVNSGTLNTEGVKKVGLILGKQFESIGFKHEWVSLPDSLKRAGHLVVSRKGTKGKKLFLVGHLDTVFEPDMPENPFKKLNDSTATGQGVNDMKGGDVIIFAALRALHQVGLIKDASITAYFTGDEEKAGVPAEVSRADFIARAKQADIALAFEGAQGLHTVATGRRGASGWLLNVQGVQAHSAGVFSNNDGAIYEAARIINTFREQLGHEKYLTFNPGIFAGGSDVLFDSATIRADVQGKTNIISPRAIVQGDLRFLSEQQKERARLNMQAIVAKNNLASTRAQITFTDGIPAMEPTAGNAKLVAILNGVTSAMGIGETVAGDPGSRGAGDISYIARYVECLDGLGASGKGAHAPGETINLKEFPLLVQRAALFIYRLTR
ncbi:M20 family peptidase [Segetibacter sp. 3557_3]|uniref:M20/M25/M40 family metallo-hydrolase n=1 Tax=Segetibacter sp. 3557_3 TaxID=2547429 RepID=UPI0010591FF7|nr:M20/M25/M40 family metallo-hydrolase [Segetibacter sp. 3557_3]TDH25675.1 M20 family peptidase [Segetibacter sp. 3557_3]